jgi:Contractile injection system tape measure protein
MADSHRIRRLRWQARATTPADGFALRTLLRERGDAVQAAFDRALEGVTADDEVLHLDRLELRLEARDLAALAGSFEEQVEASARESVRVALLQARAAAGRAGQGETRVKGAAVRHSSSAAQRDSLRHYLLTGSFDWTLAGLAPEVAARELRQAASDAAECDEAALGVMLGALGPAAQRIGAMLRWLRLLPPARRRRWVEISTPTDGSEPVSRALAALRVHLEADRPGREELQALWLAWPRLTAPAQRERWYREVITWLGLAGAGVAARMLGDALRKAQRVAPVAPAALASTAPERPAAAPRDARHDDRDTNIAMLVPMAGVVLLHPYLPRLLDACGLYTAGRQTLHADALPRACTLLHWLACGRDDTPEYELPLIKVLLGAAPDQPLIVAPAALRDADREEATALLTSIPAHWTALRGTGIEGLRTSFLQRRGLLEPRDGAWHLRMQGEAFDMLLAMLPWTIGLIRLPWMPLPLVVEWDTP